MIAAYHIASFAAAGFMAAIWSAEGWINLIVKLAFIGLALWGAVIVAKDLFL